VADILASGTLDDIDEHAVPVRGKYGNDRLPGRGLFVGLLEKLGLDYKQYPAN
jgi:hypothetical protein